MTYKFFMDAGHAWLRVPRKDLFDYGIADEISSYSYQKGNWVYLEEDMDLIRYMIARNARLLSDLGNIVEVNSHWSKIRNYPRFDMRGVM